MRRVPAVAAFLVIVSGSYVQVRGNSSELPRFFTSISQPANFSTEKKTQRLTEKELRVGTLPDSPVLVSQTTLPRLPTKPHRVTLSWQPSISTTGTNGGVISGYNVYRRSASSLRYIRLNSDLLPDTNYVDETVHAGTVYDYETTAVNSEGIESAPSNQIRLKIPYP